MPALSKSFAKAVACSHTYKNIWCLFTYILFLKNLWSWRICCPSLGSTPQDARVPKQGWSSRLDASLPLDSHIPFSLSCQDRRGPRALPAADRGRRVPPLPVRHPGGTPGPRPQLRPHHPGDPGPAQGAEGLPAILQAGEEINHRGLHLCHPLGAAPGMKGAGGARATENILAWKGPDPAPKKLNQATEN